VRECAQAGFTTYELNFDKLPWAKGNRGKYRQDIPEISVEDWINKRCPDSTMTTS
jgi:hypothetical protein